ncbi:carbohydrate kinase family protein [Telmatospirillum siberiense]|uniref:Carbohydrate kinase family protein n=1 Tax=Telmatospirillum siberiense TaxID=382514 RepID=A0A2N3PZ99_9PROT|nr:carbohydrate kinase family protein [Telmatospirillum siberiense]PKU25718.1 carbohydrate kinase family protein [Telmatospirillum siberiense]
MRMLTVGGAMIDTIAIIDSDRIERMTMFNAESSFLLLEEGGKTEAKEVSTHCGGGAVNAAVAMSRLGVDTAALVKLGRDARAETLLARLMEEGVSCRWALRDGRAPTGCSVLISSHDRNAAIFTFRGANTLLESADLHDDAFAVDAVYVSNLTNESAECFPEIVRKARAYGAIIAVNPGLRQLSAYGSAFLGCLENIDILSINRREAGALVPLLGRTAEEKGAVLALAEGGEPPLSAVKGLSGGGFEMSLPGFCRAVTALGPKYVVLTDGARGAFVATREALSFCPAAQCDVVGTAGAGDAFAATFAAFIALGRREEDALRAATWNAASVVGNVDTQTGLLPLEAIERALAGEARLPAVRRWPLCATRQTICQEG